MVICRSSVQVEPAVHSSLPVPSDDVIQTLGVRYPAGSGVLFGALFQLHEHCATRCIVMHGVGNQQGYKAYY